MSMCQQAFIYRSACVEVLEVYYAAYFSNIFFKLISYVYLCYHLKFEQQKCEDRE